jgi:hypothetical protein
VCGVPFYLHLVLRLTMGEAVFPVGTGVWCASLSPSSAGVENGISCVSIPP